jgi:BolA protein
MRVATAISAKLTEALAPVRLDIVDNSCRHAGHVGARPEGETHFRIEVVSMRFEGLDRLARQRLVHRILAAEIESHVHALELSTLTPDEDAAR